MTYILISLMFLSLLLSGAIFGFFYAWVCSTMWGLDATDPRIAIAAMQAVNGAVRNSVFFPAFFLTPAALALTAALLYRIGQRPSAAAFGAGAAVYLGFGLILTMAINVPMNEALAVVQIPQDIEAARIIWQDYSPRWQVWNTLRTIASGVTVLLAGYGIYQFGRRAG